MNRIRNWLTAHTGTAVLTWSIVVLAGSTVLLGYKTAPGTDGDAAQQWPDETSITRESGKPQLVVFAHPRCPCTEASLSELARILALCEGRVAAHLRFVVPCDASEDWKTSSLWDQAREIPGLDVAADDCGREQSRFGVRTSGHVLLYDARGRLLFSGGITAARGHSGENTGRSAVVEALSGGRPSRTRTQVFGCALDDRQTTH